jgi:hypothetical protein
MGYKLRVEYDHCNNRLSGFWMDVNFAQRLLLFVNCLMLLIEGEAIREFHVKFIFLAIQLGSENRTFKYQKHSITGQIEFR